MRTLKENNTKLPVTLIKLYLHACLLKYKSINFKTRVKRLRNKAIMKYGKRIFKISKMLPTFIFKLNKKTFKPSISHIIGIDIRTKKTLDSLEAKNRTNIIIARRPDKAKTLDSLEAKSRTNIIARRPAKASYIKLLNVSSPDSYPPPPASSPPTPPPSSIRTPPPSQSVLINELLQLSPSCLHNS